MKSHQENNNNRKKSLSPKSKYSTHINPSANNIEKEYDRMINTLNHLFLIIKNKYRQLKNANENTNDSTLKKLISEIKANKKIDKKTLLMIKKSQTTSKKDNLKVLNKIELNLVKYITQINQQLKQLEKTVPQDNNMLQIKNDQNDLNDSPQIYSRIITNQKMKKNLMNQESNIISNRQIIISNNQPIRSNERNHFGSTEEHANNYERNSIINNFMDVISTRIIDINHHNDSNEIEEPQNYSFGPILNNDSSRFNDSDIDHLLFQKEENDFDNKITDIKQLPKINVYPSTKLNEENKECTICLDDYSETHEAVFLPCFHLFHYECIESWFQKTPQCPLCKYNFKEF